MRIVKIEDFHADGGWEPFSFLKITTDDGLVGWSEFNEARGRRGLSSVIRGFSPLLVGVDPRNISSVEALLYATTRSTAGGVQAHAIGAVVNACLDIKAKALDVPVFELLGGALRNAVPVYWSHCGLYRSRLPKLFEEVIGTPAVRTTEDIKTLGKEVVARGFNALKTNAILFADGIAPRVHSAGFGRGPGHPELKADTSLIDGIVETISAFRDGVGREVEIMLDLNFNFRPEGIRRIARALEPYRLSWLELDLYDPSALAFLRRDMRTPLASLEAVLGRRAMRPFLDQNSVDVVIIDVQWNGVPESMRMAALADAHEVNIASHNSSGPLGTAMSAHLCAVVPNFQIMELDVDEVPWRSSLLSHPLDVRDGHFHLSSRPGWGFDVNEDTVTRHPAAG